MEGLQLSEGAIREIRLSGEPSVVEPVVQALSVKKVGGSGGNGDRYRAIVSDGQTFQQAMLATHLNPLADSGELGRYTIMKLVEYSVNLVKERVILIIHQIEVLGTVEGKIGEPASVDIFLQAERDEQAAQGGGAATSYGNGNQHGEEQKPQVSANPYNSNANGGRAANGAARQGGAAHLNNRQQAGMGTSSGQQHPIYPIEGLSPYQNKWTIKARVTNKSDIRHWSNARGEGKLFSVTFLDESGEIKATGFNDAVDQFYNLLEEGKVYFVSKARVGIAKRQFSNVNNEYEITLENSSEINLCTDQENVPQVKYSFVELNQLESVEPNSIIDVIGVVKETGEIGQIVSKATQKPITKRELTLVDASGMSVRLTLWGRQAETFTAAGGHNEDGSPQQPVIAFKAVRVGDFNGRSLSMVSSSNMAVDPDIPEAHALRGWYDNQGESTNFQAFNSAGGAASGAGASMRLDQFKVIGDVKDEMLGTGDQPDNFWVRAHLVYIKKENISYPACPTPKCGKKMMMEDTNSWRCEKCDRTFPEPEYRYILSGQVADFTGFLYFSCFNEIGQQLLGKSADEMESLKNTDEAAFDRAISEPVGTTWNLSIRAKSDNWGDQQRIRYNIMRAVPAGYSGEEGQKLLDLIKAYGDVQI